MRHLRIVSGVPESCVSLLFGPWPQAKASPEYVHACMLNHFSRIQLCNPMDCSLPGSSVCGIIQAKILEWVAMPSSRGPPQPRDQTLISYVSCIASEFFTTSATCPTVL